MQVWCDRQVTVCDPHLSALEVRFSWRCAIQIDVYLYLTRVSLVLLGLVFGVSCVYLCISCIYLGCCKFVLSVPLPSDWLERLIPEMTYYLSSGTLISTHSLTHSYTVYMTGKQRTSCHITRMLICADCYTAGEFVVITGVVWMLQMFAGRKWFLSSIN